MAHAGVRSRALRGIVLVVLASSAACTAIAGIGSKEIDQCFDGCDGSVATDGGSASDAPAADTSVPSDAGGGDSGACACPTGTHAINGVCVSDLPATNLECMSPLQLPDCALKLSLRVCDGDPGFDYAVNCTSGPNTGPRPSSFVRLGKSPTTKWKLVITGAHNVARPNAACDRGDSPCGTRDGGSASGTTTFTSPALPDDDSVVFGKPDVAGCQDISVDVQIGDAG